MSTRDGLVRTKVGNYYDPTDPGEEHGYHRHHRPRRSIAEAEWPLLAELARGRVVLELGTGVGVSARVMAATAKAVVTVDPDSWVQHPGPENVTFLREAPKDTSPFDMAFIDGDHSEQGCAEDIEKCRCIPLLVLHDTNLKEVRRAIARYASAGLTEVEAHNTPGRLAVYRWAKGGNQ